MVVAYHLGGRLGHGVWPWVVGWIFGTVDVWESQNPETPDKRHTDPHHVPFFFHQRPGGRPYQAPALIAGIPPDNKITAPPVFPPVVHLEFCFGFTK